MPIHDTPVVPRLASWAGGCAKSKVILAWLVALESASVRDREVLLDRILLFHFPAPGELIKVLAKELGDLRVLQWLAGVGDMMLKEMVKLFFVGEELKRCCLVLVRFEAVHYIVGPVEVSYVHEVVCKAGEKDKKYERLLRESGL